MENRGPMLLVLNGTFMGFMLWSMALRMWVRLGLVKSWGWDDSLMAVAVVVYAIYLSFSMHAAVYATGRHRSEVPMIDYEIAMKSWWICYPFYSAVMIASKLSIGYFLLRVSVRRLHIWILYITMSVTMCAGLAFFIGSFLQCRPLSYWWTRYRDPDGGSCIDPTIIIVLAYIYSFFAIVSDAMMALFPVLLISSLNMNRQMKMMLIPLMAMGTIASLGLVVRLPWLMKLRDTDDFLWSTVDVVIWSTVEGGLAITAGNLATTRPLYRHVMQKLGLTQPTYEAGHGGASDSLGPSDCKTGGTQDSRHKQSSHRRGGGGSSGSFSLGIATVFGGTAGAYPLSEIDDSEYTSGGERDRKQGTRVDIQSHPNIGNSNDEHYNNNIRSPLNNNKGFPHNSGHVAAQYNRSNSFTRLASTLQNNNNNNSNNNNNNSAPTKEGITTMTSIVTTTAPADSNVRPIPRHDDTKGFYFDGRPYGTRTQIVAGDAAVGDGSEGGPISDKRRPSLSDEERHRNQRGGRHHRLASSESQEELYSHVTTAVRRPALAVTRHGSSGGVAQVPRGLRRTADQR